MFAGHRADAVRFEYFCQLELGFASHMSGRCFARRRECGDRPLRRHLSPGTGAALGRLPLLHECRPDSQSVSIGSRGRSPGSTLQPRQSGRALRERRGRPRRRPRQRPPRRTARRTPTGIDPAWTTSRAPGKRTAGRSSTRGGSPRHRLPCMRSGSREWAGRRGRVRTSRGYCQHPRPGIARITPPSPRA